MIQVIGAGAVGTVLATFLSQAGRDLGLFTRGKDRAAFEARRECRVDGDDGQLLCRAPVPPLITKPFTQDGDILLLCIKAGGLDGLIATLAGLPPRCIIVSTLNGVAPLRKLRSAFPAHQVVPLSILMNSQLEGPLHARLTTRPEMYLGSTDKALQKRFAGTGIRCVNVEGDAAVWGKLLINLANAICALTRTTFRDLFVNKCLRRCYVAVLDEATAVLDAAGIHWQLPLAVPYRVYRWMLLRGGPLPWWVAHFKNGVGDGAYPSMVADVSAGRPTEIRELNGEILALGREHGIATPINALLVERIEASATPAPLSPEQLNEVLGLSRTA